MALPTGFAKGRGALRSTFESVTPAWQSPEEVLGGRSAHLVIANRRGRGRDHVDRQVFEDIPRALEPSILQVCLKHAIGRI